MKGALKAFSVLLVMLALVTMVRAETQPYDITEVDVEGLSIYEGMETRTIYVERGEMVTVDVFLRGTEDSDPKTTWTIDNVRVEVELGGYDRDVVRDVTDSFIVEEGVYYPAKRLTLEIPQDLDARDTYTLRVRVYDRYNSVEWGDDPTPKEEDIELRVTESEHYLRVLDVSFDPNLNQVQPGDRLTADVRVENYGYQTEEDVRVEMSIPTLSIMDSSYIDVLNADRECEDDDDDGDREDRYHDGRCENSESQIVSLTIPSTAQGQHQVFVKVYYDEGDEVIEQVYQLTLTAQPDETEPSIVTKIDVDAKTQTLESGEGVVYTVSIANLGSESTTYTLSLKGLESWATYRVDPSTVEVGSKGSEDVFVFVTANEDATDGSKSFVLEVTSSKGTEEITLMATVSESDTKTPWDSIKLGLEIGFIVLLVILIVLGLVLAFRKKDKDKPEGAEGEDTYY